MLPFLATHPRTHLSINTSPARAFLKSLVYDDDLSILRCRYIIEHLV